MRRNVSRDTCSIVLAGLDYLYLSTLDAANWAYQPGDMLFLIRNVFCCSEGYIHEVARRYLEEVDIYSYVDIYMHNLI